MILHNFNSLRAFTVYSLWFEISLRSNWSKWHLHRSKFHFARSQWNTDNEINLHQSEILRRNENTSQFEFTSGQFYLTTTVKKSYNSCQHYILKVNNRNSRTSRKIFSKLTSKDPDDVNNIIRCSFLLTSNII